MIVEHTVAKGDTLNSIAKKYKSTVGQIQCLNNIDGIESLAIGQVLKILINKNEGVTNQPKNTLVDCRVILPRRLYFSIYYQVSDGAFKKASDTWKTTIQGDPKKWNPDLDIFLDFEVKFETMFIAAWKKIKSTEEKQAMTVAEGSVFSHSSKSDVEKGGLEFRPDSIDRAVAPFENGTLNKTEIAALPKLHWSNLGALYLHGCNTGKKIEGRNWTTGSVFADTQQIKTYGEAGYSYFSSSKENYVETTPADKSVYLHAYLRAKNVTLKIGGSGQRIASTLHTPQPKAK
jgi:LysM repeat protein